MCTLLQLMLLGLLTHLGFDRVVANGVGYAVAAQVNFALSATFTWGDRKPRLPRRARRARAAAFSRWLVRWAKFNTVAIAGLAVNEGVFAAALHAGLTLYMAAAAGLVSAALLTFTANQLVTFPARKGSQEAERPPRAQQIRLTVQQEGVAFFLPAFNEASNLRAFVPLIVRYFEHLACPFTVIVVDDGSTRDKTYEVAERLAEAYPDHVQALHHARNEGYGAALRSGLAAALRTGHGLIAFCDADGQFDIASFGTLVAALQEQRADAAVGYRIARADSLRRQVLGRGWRLLSRRALGVREVRDVDCGFKVFTRRVVWDILPDLRGGYATVSPEILYRAAAAGYRITEAGVTHHPRAYGQQTGSNLKVIAGSVVHLARLRSQLRQESRVEQSAAVGSSAVMPAYLSRLVAFAAAGLSVAAYFVTARLHATLLYVDTISHMEIARRVVNSTSAGLAQLGGVWLPLQHMLMLPFIWDDSFYQNGFAGTVVSMVAFVATTVLVYKIACRLTGQAVAGLVAAAVFALNPNMLYMQSTPMTEPLLYCMTAGMIYCVQQWASTDRYQYLIGGGVFAFFGTLTRYETWPITACLILAVAITAWCRLRGGGMNSHLRWAGVRDRVTVFSVVALAGIAGWAVWNWILFGNPLNFQDGQYAKPALWLSAGDVGLRHWMVAAKTYAYAMRYDETWPVLALAAAGLVAMLAIEWRSRKTLGRSLPVLSTLIMIPFFIVSIYTGQRPLYVIPLYSKFENVRFALIMLLPAAILVGYLIGALRRCRPVMLVVASLVVLATASIGFGLIHYRNVVTYNEPHYLNETTQRQDERDVIAFLAVHYHTGKVLMQSFGNELVAFHLPSDELVYEGSFRQWQPALRDPVTSNIRWIIEWCGSPADQVCNTEKAAQLRPYRLVYTSPGLGYRVYEQSG